MDLFTKRAAPAEVQGRGTHAALAPMTNGLEIVEKSAAGDEPPPYGMRCREAAEEARPDEVCG
jgi:hypothetical protein